MAAYLRWDIHAPFYLSCQLVIHAIYLTTISPSLPPPNFQKTIKTRFLILNTFPPFCCCPNPEFFLFPNENFSVSLQLILLANKASVIFCALYHHLTCLMFTSIMKKFVLSLNGWDLNFLRNIYIWENVYTQNNSTSSGGIRQSEDISATFIQRS